MTTMSCEFSLFQTFGLAGFCAGITEGILVNPFEVVKVRLQSSRALMKNSPTTFTVTKQIIKENGLGLNGLYKGLSATVLRNGVFNCYYFGFYHTVKNLIPVNKDPWIEFTTKVKSLRNIKLLFFNYRRK